MIYDNKLEKNNLQKTQVKMSEYMTDSDIMSDEMVRIHVDDFLENVCLG